MNHSPRLLGFILGPRAGSSSSPAWHPGHASLLHHVILSQSLTAHRSKMSELRRVLVFEHRAVFVTIESTQQSVFMCI